MNKINYELIAPSYNQLYREEQLSKLAKIKEFMLKNFKITKTTRILDIGSGTGISTIYFSEKAIGIEPSLSMIKHGKYNAIQASAESLPFKSHSFDVVVSVTAFHNFKDPEKAIKEIKKILKPHHFLAITLLKRIPSYHKLKQLLEKNFRFYELDEAKDTILIEIE